MSEFFRRVAEAVTEPGGYEEHAEQFCQHRLDETVYRMTVDGGGVFLECRLCAKSPDLGDDTEILCMDPVNVRIAYEKQHCVCRCSSECDCGGFLVMSPATD